MPKLVDGGRERGRGCDGEYDGEIDALGDDEGVDPGVRRGVAGGDGLNLRGGTGRGCIEAYVRKSPTFLHFWCTRARRARRWRCARIPGAPGRAAYRVWTLQGKSAREDSQSEAVGIPDALNQDHQNGKEDDPDFFHLSPRSCGRNPRRGGIVPNDTNASGLRENLLQVSVRTTGHGAEERRCRQRLQPCGRAWTPFETKSLSSKKTERRPSPGRRQSPSNQ